MTTPDAVRILRERKDAKLDKVADYICTLHAALGQSCLDAKPRLLDTYEMPQQISTRSGN